ncbi:putative EMG1 NEP1 methyltransferase [Trypanosoma vivax]|nr:hypothetical protein TRVL_04063 [Trypanosoma vivax]KAH8617344.1 putative EMG1 NEP1 methyltransferase [Trypanosoma vivax]
MISSRQAVQSPCSGSLINKEAQVGRKRTWGARDCSRASSVYRPLCHSGGSGRSDLAKASTSVVVILEKAGLLLGREGVVDAYDRAGTTEIANESLRDVRPDIVHQCLLALFDSELAQSSKCTLRVFINIFVRGGRTVEVSPGLRPPRTLRRFKGLVAALLRDGIVRSNEGDVLLQILPGSLAPVLPYGAQVVGLTNAHSAPVLTPSKLALTTLERPVDDSLQGGIKGVAGFFCIPCTEDGSLDGIDYVTRQVCLSAYPMTAHVMCARLCEGFSRAVDVNGASV